MPPAREVFRGPAAAVVWWVWVVVALVGLADLAVTGRDHASAVAVAVIAVVTGALYAGALRPRIVADPAGITLSNPFREHRVPWGSVERVDVSGALRVHCRAAPGEPSGKVLASWAVQSSPRSALRRDMADRRATAREGRLRRRAGGGPPAGGGARQREPDALDRLSAESVARRLQERVERERRAGAQPGPRTARWAWLPVAALVVPVALLVALVLA